MSSSSFSAAYYGGSAPSSGSASASVLDSQFLFQASGDFGNGSRASAAVSARLHAHLLLLLPLPLPLAIAPRIQTSASHRTVPSRRRPTSTVM